MKLYYFCNTDCGGRGDWHSALLVSEEGEFLRGHICSNHGFMYHDLVERPKAEHDARWPEGWTAEEIEDPKHSSLLDGLVALAKERDAQRSEKP